MYHSVYDLKDFYASHPGRLVRRLLTDHIRKMWPDLRGQRLMGYGYAPPYLRALMEGTERSFAVMPAGGGAHTWPEGEANLACLSPESQLPVETESVDRILMVHGLEYAGSPQDVLHEMWRVLKSNGRLLMIVPSRRGFWARADWTPFGHGTPYTASQISHYLQESLFVHERTEKALYMPPFRSFFVLRTAYAFENLGRGIFPGLSGVHLIEASKQVYAPSSGLKQAARAGGRRYAVRAVPTS
ncbi:MAG TPA: methyltransferase domain-containing protein [Alphaproteobacteria bacterium]|jgi:SAM-dependent methyltransferase